MFHLSVCSGVVVTFSGQSHGLAPALVLVPGVRLVVKDKPTSASAEDFVAEPMRVEREKNTRFQLRRAVRGILGR